MAGPCNHVAAWHGAAAGKFLEHRTLIPSGLPEPAFAGGGPAIQRSAGAHRRVALGVGTRPGVGASAGAQLGDALVELGAKPGGQGLPLGLAACIGGGGAAGLRRAVRVRERCGPVIRSSIGLWVGMAVFSQVAAEGVLAARSGPISHQ